MLLPRTSRLGSCLAPVVLAALVGFPLEEAAALKSDRDQQIQIEADWAEADDGKGVTVYKGKVLIVQGSLRISGDVVTMYFDEARELQRMVAVGNLARFRQKPDGEEEYQNARARQIHYEVPSDTMILTGDASLAKGADRMTADRIVYDTLNARIKGESVAVKSADPDSAPSKPGRVSIIIQPKKRCADGTRRTTCPE